MARKDGTSLSRNARDHAPEPHPTSSTDFGAIRSVINGTIRLADRADVEF
jgi:hypothetical protein